MLQICRETLTDGDEIILLTDLAFVYLSFYDDVTFVCDFEFWKSHQDVALFYKRTVHRVQTGYNLFHALATLVLNP